MKSVRYVFKNAFTFDDLRSTLNINDLISQSTSVEDLVVFSEQHKKNNFFEIVETVESSIVALRRKKRKSSKT